MDGLSQAGTAEGRESILSNAYLDRRNAELQLALTTGEQAGWQEAVDMFSLALSDPDVMGGDAFGQERMARVLDSVREYFRYFRLAWQMAPESDYMQELIDRRLKALYKDQFTPFEARYREYGLRPQQYGRKVVGK